MEDFDDDEFNEVQEEENGNKVVERNEGEKEGNVEKNMEVLGK
jgi:hypothetical protein